MYNLNPPVLTIRSASSMHSAFFSSAQCPLTRHLPLMTLVRTIGSRQESNVFAPLSDLTGMKPSTQRQWPKEPEALAAVTEGLWRDSGRRLLTMLSKLTLKK
jgi:hypothetical protein